MNRVAVASALAVLSIAVTGVSANATIPPALYGTASTSGGYEVSPSTLTSVGASWMVPSVTCPTPAASVSVSVGLIQTATGRYARLGVDVDCHSGRPSYGTWIRLPEGRRAALKLPVAAGDHVQAHLAAPDGRLGGSMSDKEQGWAALISTHSTLHPTTAGMLVFQRRSATGAHPLARFTPVHFGSSRVNGLPIAGQVRRLVMRYGHGRPLVETSSLRRPMGAFVVTDRRP